MDEENISQEELVRAVREAHERIGVLEATVEALLAVTNALKREVLPSAPDPEVGLP